MGQETVICRLGWVRIFQMPGSRLRMRAAPSNSWSIAPKTDPLAAMSLLRACQGSTVSGTGGGETGQPNVARPSESNAPLRGVSGARRTRPSLSIDRTPRPALGGPVIADGIMRVYEKRCRNRQGPLAAGD